MASANASAPWVRAADSERDPASPDVWLLRHDATDRDVQRCVSLLDDGERQRMARIPTPDAQRSFVISHAFLRTTLTRYLPEVAAPDWRYVANPWGKPTAVQRHDAPLHFSLSHTQDLSVVAVAEHPIGVDVERVEAHPDLSLMSQSFFSASEQAWMAHSTSEARGFYAIWTLKEATVKALGLGMAIPLAAFSVAPDSARVTLDDPGAFSAIPELDLEAIRQLITRQTFLGDDGVLALAHPARAETPTPAPRFLIADFETVLESL